MKTLSKLFVLFAVLLSDIMCAVVAYNYCDILWGTKYAGYSVSASTAFTLAIPYIVGIIAFVALALTFNKKAKKQS